MIGLKERWCGSPVTLRRPYRSRRSWSPAGSWPAPLVMKPPPRPD